MHTFDGEGVPGSEHDAGEAFESAFLSVATEPAAAPAAPDTAKPAPAAEPSGSAEQPTTGQPRDEAGRFISPPHQAAPETAESAAAAAAPGAPDESTAAAPGEQPAAAPAQPDAAAAPPAEQRPEVVFRADGKHWSIPGSAVGADGAVAIPAAVVPDVLKLLAAGQVHTGSFQQRLAEKDQLVQRSDRRAQSAEAERDALLTKLDEMFEKGTLADWLQNIEQNYPIMRAEAKTKGLEIQSQAEREELERYRSEQSRQHLEPQMQDALERTILHFGGKAGLDRDAMSELYRRLNTPRFRSQIFVRADTDDPGHGIRKGELVVEFDVIRDEVQWASQFGGRRADGQARVQAAERENARLAGQPVKAPPTVAARGAGAPPARAPVKDYTSAEEADNDIWGKGFKDLATR